MATVISEPKPSLPVYGVSSHVTESPDEIQTTLLEILCCFLNTSTLFNSQEINSLLVKSAQSVLIFWINKTSY